MHHLDLPVQAYKSIIGHLQNSVYSKLRTLIWNLEETSLQLKFDHLLSNLSYVNYNR